jgi:hypothetical protein
MVTRDPAGQRADMVAYAAAVARQIVDRRRQIVDFADDASRNAD